MGVQVRHVSRRGWALPNGDGGWHLVGLLEAPCISAVRQPKRRCARLCETGRGQRQYTRLSG